MPSFESPALYIDFSRLPPPKVIEDIDYEALLKVYQDKVVELRPDLAKAVTLNQSPTNVILQAEAYGNMMVRARINAAARAVMLPFATGSDLDVLGAFYNEARQQILVEGSNPVRYEPESDERFRRRIQLAPEAFSTAGSVGAYIYHALKADPTIRDVSVMKINDRGGIKVSVMNSGTDPKPTDAQLTAVTTKLFSKNIKPLTDVVSVAPVKVIETTLVANIRLYPGPDASMIFADIKKAVEAVRGRIALTGRDLTRSALFAAINQEGVQGVDLISPAADIVAQPDECVWIKSATLNILDARGE